MVLGIIALAALAAVLGWRSPASPKDEVPAQARELHRATKRIIQRRGNDPAWANEVRADWSWWKVWRLSTRRSGTIDKPGTTLTAIAHR
jgi:hypothetical protein